jgi:TonB family protein
MRAVMTRATTREAIGVAGALSAVGSLASHIGLTWAALTFAPAPLPDASHDPLVTSRFLYPLMQQRPRPQVERVSFVGVGGTQEPAATAAPDGTGATAGTAEESVAAIDAVEMIVTDQYESYSELEVDVAAERSPDSEGPSYPDSLLARQVEGEARVRFVIDAQGNAIEESFGVIETNHAGFAEAVRRALPRMRFKPAAMGTRTVAQRVEQTFVFKITRPAVVP